MGSGRHGCTLGGHFTLFKGGGLLGGCRPPNPPPYLGELPPPDPQGRPQTTLMNVINFIGPQSLATSAASHFNSVGRTHFNSVGRTRTCSLTAASLCSARRPALEPEGVHFEPGGRRKHECTLVSYRCRVRAMSDWFFGDRKSSSLGVWAAPGARETLPEGGGQSPPPF